MEKIFNDVDSPAHYTDTNIEVIDYIEDKGWGEGFCIGNAIKYLSRAGKKSDTNKSIKEKEIEDLEKAVWYINRRIKQLKREMNINRENDNKKFDDLYLEEIMKELFNNNK